MRACQGDGMFKTEILVACVTETEFDALTSVMRPDAELTGPGGRTYYVKEKLPEAPSGREHWRVSLVQSKDQGQAAMHELISDALRWVEPRYVFLIGTAGGIWNDDDRKSMGTKNEPRVNLGSVVISRNVRYVGKGRSHGHKFELKEDPIMPPLHSLVLRARDLAKKWTPPPEVQIPYNENKSVKFGQPRLVDMLSADTLERKQSNKTEHTRFQQVTQSIPDAASIDMESAAIGNVLYSLQGRTTCLGYLVIRAISDLVNVVGKDSEEIRDRWRSCAAQMAAHFGLYVVETLKSSPIDNGESLHPSLQRWFGENPPTIWFQDIPPTDEESSKTDVVHVYSWGPNISGTIKRVEPKSGQELGKEWRFEGRLLEPDMIVLTFWSVGSKNHAQDPLSYGTITLCLDPNNMQGIYVRHPKTKGERSSVAMKPYALVWRRNNPRLNGQPALGQSQEDIKPAYE